MHRFVTLFLITACTSDPAIFGEDMEMGVGIEEAPEGSLVFSLVPINNIASILVSYQTSEMNADEWIGVSWENASDTDDVLDFTLFGAPAKGSFSYVGKQINGDTPLCTIDEDGDRGHPVGDIYVTLLLEGNLVQDMEVDADNDSCVITHTWALYAD